MTHGTPFAHPAARFRTIQDAAAHFLARWAADQILNDAVDRLAADLMADLSATPDNGCPRPDLIRTRRLDD